MPRSGRRGLTEYLVEGERVRTLPDLLAPGLRLLFVGYNPSVRAARLGHYYAGRNNRFWDLLAVSGLTPERWSFERDGELPALGIGVTDLVKRPTRSAAEVTPEEFRLGAERFRGIVRELRPRVVCFNGKGVYLQVAGVRSAPWGRQARPLVEGTMDFVAPSPSGLARIPFAEKARWYAELQALVRSLDV